MLGVTTRTCNYEQKTKEKECAPCFDVFDPGKLLEARCKGNKLQAREEFPFSHRFLNFFVGSNILRKIKIKDLFFFIFKAAVSKRIQHQKYLWMFDTLIRLKN